MLLRFFAAALGPWFWLTGILCFALGFVLPGDWSPVRPWLVPGLLAGILFFTSLKLDLGAVLAAVADRARWRQVGLMSVAKLLLLPLAVWGLTYLIAPDWAGGLALVCLMPAGLSSIAYTDLLKGNSVLALLLVVATSLLAPISIPLLLQVVQPGTTPDLRMLLERAVFIVAMLTVPFTAAQVVRRIALGWVERHRPLWSPLAVLSSVLLAGLAVTVNKDAWAGVPLATFIAPLLLTTGATALALAVGWASRRWWGAPDALAFTCGCLYLNNGLGVAVASRFFPGDTHMVLPAILISLPMLGLIAVLARLARRHPERSGPAEF